MIAVAVLGFIFGIGAQLAQLCDLAKKTDQEAKARRRLLTKTEDNLWAATDLYYVAIVCEFAPEANIDALSRSGAFALDVAFMQGGQPTMNVRCSTQSKGTSFVRSCNGALVLGGGVQNARLPLPWEVQLYAASALRSEDVFPQLWIRLYTKEVMHRFSEVPGFVYWPYSKIGDFVGTMLTTRTDGTAARWLSRMYLLLNRGQFVVEVPLDAQHRPANLSDIFKAKKP
jgi:hypothetical protein